MSRRRPFWDLRRRSVSGEVDEELSLHLEMRIDELIAGGLAPEDARREALRQFGDLEATRNYCRQQDEERENVMQRALLFQDFMQDLRIGVRSLLRAPVLTLTIIVTVGLGLGATAAIFSAVDAALLRPGGRMSWASRSGSTAPTTHLSGSFRRRPLRSIGASICS